MNWEQWTLVSWLTWVAVFNIHTHEQKMAGRSRGMVPVKSQSASLLLSLCLSGLLIWLVVHA